MLASYPGLFTTTPPMDESPFGVYWPALVPADVPEQVLVLENGTEIPIPHTAAVYEQSLCSFKARVPPAVTVPGGPTKRIPLGTVYGARSGDKGGNANVGIWGRSDEDYAWLAATLTVECFQQLVPETAHLEVRRFELPNLRALNFVVVGLLGEGVASSVRFDGQAKSLGEYLRSRIVDLPEVLLK